MFLKISSFVKERVCEWWRNFWVNFPFQGNYRLEYWYFWNPKQRIFCKQNKVRFTFCCCLIINDRRTTDCCVMKIIYSSLDLRKNATGSIRGINPGVWKRALYWYAHTHSSVIISPWRLSDQIPLQLVKGTERHHISTGYYSVWRARERDCQSVYECVSERWNALPASSGTVTA